MASHSSLEAETIAHQDCKEHTNGALASKQETLTTGGRQSASQGLFRDSCTGGTFPAVGFITEVELEFDRIERLIEENLWRKWWSYLGQRGWKAPRDIAAVLPLAAVPIRRVKIEVRDGHGALLGSTCYVDYEKQGNQAIFRRQRVRFFLHTTSHQDSHTSLDIHIIGRVTPLKRYSSYVLPLPPAELAMGESDQHRNYVLGNTAQRELYFASLPVDDSAALLPVRFPKALLQANQNKPPFSSRNDREMSPEAAVDETTDDATETSQRPAVSRHHEIHPVRLHLGRCQLELKTLWAHQETSIHCTVHGAGRHTKLIIHSKVSILPFCSMSLPARLPIFPQGSYSFRIHIHDVSIIQSSQRKWVSMNSVVYVHALDETQHTQVCRWSFTAIFDRMLFFSKTLGQEQIQDELITIAVWNWNFWRPSQLIGSHSFDFLHLWNQKDHCIRHKWLPLTCTSGEQSDLVGYICISAVVYGPGIMPATESAADATQMTMVQGIAPRLLKNLIVQRPYLSIENWRVQLAILEIELARSADTEVHGDNSPENVALAHVKRSNTSILKASKLERMLLGTAADASSPQKRIYFEILFAQHDKKVTVMSEVVSVPVNTAAKLSMGFCLPLSLTSAGETSLEDIVIGIRESPSKQTITDVHLPLSNLLQRGCTAAIAYPDAGQLSHCRRTPDHHDRQSLSSRETIQTGVQGRAQHWLRRLEAWLRNKPSGHIRERRVFEMRPRYIHFYESPTKYLGRILIAARMWPHSEHCKAVPLWYHRLNWDDEFTALQRAPHRFRHVLHVQLQRITELVVPDSSHILAHLCIGQRRLASTDDAIIRERVAQMSSFHVVHPLEARTAENGITSIHLELEQDWHNIPDIFLHLYHRSGPHAPKRCFSLLRLPASLLRALPEDKVCRPWLLDKPTDSDSLSASVAGTAYLYICLRQADKEESPSSAGLRPAESIPSKTTTGAVARPLPNVSMKQVYWVDCKIIRCQNLPAADPTGFSDPFVVVRFGSVRKNGTRLCHQTCDPTFFERLRVGPVHLRPNEVVPPVSVKIFDWDSDPEAFDPARLEKAQFLCRADVDLTNLTSAKPVWFDMFISNPMTIHGSMLASFALQKVAFDGMLDPSTPSNEIQAADDIFSDSLNRLVPARPEEDEIVEAEEPSAWIDPQIPTWLVAQQGETASGPADRYLLVGLLSIRQLGLRKFGLDPSRESLRLRLYLNFRDGIYRTVPFHFSDGNGFSANRNNFIDTILMPLPAKVDSIASLHIILESADGETFFASANIPPEEWTGKRLLVGGLQQYGLEYLDEAMSLRKSKRKERKVVAQRARATAAMETSPESPFMNLERIRQRLRERWHHDVRGSIQALWAALVNFLVELAPEFALRFGMEETEFPPSSLTPWLRRFFHLVHHRGLVAALEHYEDASLSTQHKVHSLQHGRTWHGQRGNASLHVHEELEKHLQSCSAYGEALLRHGLARRKKRTAQLLSKLHSHHKTEAKQSTVPTTSAESTPQRRRRLLPFRRKSSKNASAEKSPANAVENARAAPQLEKQAVQCGIPTPAGEHGSEERLSRTSWAARLSSSRPANGSKSTEGSDKQQQQATGAQRNAPTKANSTAIIQRRARVRTRREEAQDRLALLHQESRRYQDPVPVGKLALVLRILETGTPADSGSQEDAAHLPLIERVPDVHQFRADYHRHLQRRFQARNDVVVRLHVFHARGLRAPSGDPNIYLKVELNGGEQVQSTKTSPVRHSLHPDLFCSFEFTGVRMPGSSLLIRVKHFSGPDFEVPNAAVLLPRYANWTFGPFVHQAMSKDLRVDFVRTRVGHGILLGETEIDLDQRWYADGDTYARAEPPTETRRLYMPNRVIPRGELTLRLELLSAAEASARPFRPLTPPAPRAYELRLVVWRVIGCKREGTEKAALQGSATELYGSASTDTSRLMPAMNLGLGGSTSPEITVPLQDLEVRAQLGNDISAEMHTSVVHNCDDGSANFNYRLIWRPLHWPHPEFVPRLRLHVWDVRKPTAFPIIGQLTPAEPVLLATVTLDLGSIFEEARHRHEPTHRPRQWISMHRVGTSSTVVVPRVELSLDLLNEEQARQHPEGSQVGQSGLPEPLQPVPFSAFAPQRYVRYRIARLWQDGFWYVVQAALLIPSAIALLKILAAIPLFLYLVGGALGILLVLRMRRVEQQLEFV
jgi:hypothetical protein